MSEKRSGQTGNGSHLSNDDPERKQAPDITITAPGLLIAMPQLNDPNFEKTVVLMIEHNTQGALGLVVNRPSIVKVNDIFDALGIEWHGPDDSVVWSGGPVMHELGWALHEPIELLSQTGVMEVVPGLVLSTSTDRLHELAVDPPQKMRFILGGAGWGPSQLDWELAEGVWMTAEADPALIFDVPPEEMWEAAFRSMGIDPGMLVQSDGIN